MTAEPTASAESSRIGFKFNIYTAIWLCLIFGIFVSGYLSYAKLTETPTVCMANGMFDCATVQNSIYSRFMGIPIAWLGLGMYLVLTALVILKPRIPFLQDNGTMIFFGICLFGWVYSMYLVYLQVVVLGALCQWCLMHELNMTILFGLAVVELKRALA